MEEWEYIVINVYKHGGVSICYRAVTVPKCSKEIILLEYARCVHVSDSVINYDWKTNY